MNESVTLLEQIYQNAKELRSPEQREVYLREACKNAPEARSQVEALLRASESADHAFETYSSAAPTLADTELREGLGTVIGRYKLLQKIGEGGMGIVYMAEQEEPVKRKVALKVIKLGMDTKSVVARFEAERQALAMMDHPNIARVLDGGATESGRPYFAMELVKGIPINEFCDKNKLSVRRRLELFTQVCQAVHSAHQKGVIHRDIKPSNVLVTLHNGDPMPKVIDFGVAKATNQKLTEKTLFTNFAQMIGTPAYMSPEQAEMSSMDVDTRTDVYSLGVLLYELLTGSTPFPQKSLLSKGYAEMQRILQQEQPARPSLRLSTFDGAQQSIVAQNRQADMKHIGREVRGDIDWIVMKSLEKDRTRRYESASSLAEDVVRHLNDQPVLAVRPSIGYQFSKFYRRHRPALAAAAAVAVSLVLGTVVSTAQAISAKAARREAVKAKSEAELAAMNESQLRQEAQAQTRQAQHNLYVAKMNLAQRAWEDSDFKTASRLLDETESWSDRGFEWSYWKQKSQRETLIITNEFGTGGAIDYSPDGTRIATGGGLIYDSRSGKRVLKLEGENGFFNSVQYSSSGDKILAALSVRRSRGNVGVPMLRVWDSNTGALETSIEAPATNKGLAPFIEAVFSPDGTRILTAEQTGARIWDAETGAEILRLDQPDSQVMSARYSPDGQRIATTTEDPSLRVWNATSGERLLDITELPSNAYRIEWSPDGKRLASITWAGLMSIHDAETGKLIRTIDEKGDLSMCLAFSPDGEFLAVCSGTNLRIHHVDTGLPYVETPAHDYLVHGVRFSPDGQFIATSGGVDATSVKLWRVSDLPARRDLLDTDETVHTVRFTQDGSRLITLGYVWNKPQPGEPQPKPNQTLRIWNAKTGVQEREIQLPVKYEWHPEFFLVEPGSSGPSIMAISESADRDTAMSFYRLENGEPSAPNAWTNGVPFTGTLLDISRDGKRLVTEEPTYDPAEWDELNLEEAMTWRWRTTVWDFETGRPIKTLERRLRNVAFSEDGRFLTFLDPRSAPEDSKAKVIITRKSGERWRYQIHLTQIEIESGMERFASLTDYDSISKYPIAISPDGSMLLTTGSRSFKQEDMSVKLWDAETGDLIQDIPFHDDAIPSAIFTPNQRRIIIASNEGDVQFWDIESQMAALNLRPFHHSAVVAMSPDGKRLAAAGGWFADRADAYIPGAERWHFTYLWDLSKAD